jgi:hypothetical protein
MANRSGWKAPKSVTSNFCLPCSPQLFEFISSLHRNSKRKTPAKNSWQQKYLLPNASTKLLLSIDIKGQLDGKDEKLLYTACQQFNIQIIHG